MNIIPWESEFPISRYLSEKAGSMGVPISGTFELTSRCNFNCKMCYVHEQKNKEDLKARELSVSQWMDIAEEAKSQGLLFLLLTGGEAMIREDFLELYQELSVMGFRVSINTNGSLLSEEALECFRKYPPGRINVSLYGASEDTYEDLCEVRAMGRVKKAIHELRQTGIPVRTTMMLTAYNCQDMEAVYRFAKEEDTMIGLSSYIFPPVRLDGQSCGSNRGRLSAGDAGRYMVQREKLMLSADEFNRHARWALDENKPVPVAQGGEDGLGDPVLCMAGRGSFWITWDGKLRPCGLVTEPEADVLTDGFTAAWEKIRQMTGQIHLPIECKTCKDKELCRVCAAMCQSETGKFDQRPDYVCRMVEAMKAEYAFQLTDAQL